VGTQGVVTFTGTNTVSGAGSLTNNGIINQNGTVTFNVPVTNGGLIEQTLVTFTINGAFSTLPTSVLRMNPSLTSITMTFANGFTNSGIIDLSGTWVDTLQVTSGPLVNRGYIITSGAPTRNLDLELDNRPGSVVTVDNTNINQPVYLYSPSGTITNSSTLAITGGKLSVSSGGALPLNFTNTSSGIIVIAANQVLGVTRSTSAFINVFNWDELVTDYEKLR
jgi:hypothetical protein